ncbi:cytoplasmic polyadenylation element-binding protein 2-like isoform X2 [Sycon ciliatum]|uniref:cytoplasmic polyadenylation element-binding protein 2-like isoform X2 n=1 Tax=Sycon ciliatum TaxID=27933 RepID=UPI0031F714A6
MFSQTADIYDPVNPDAGSQHSRAASFLAAQQYNTSAAEAMDMSDPPVCMRDFSPLSRVPSSQTSEQDRARALFLNSASKLNDVQFRATPVPLKMKLQESLAHNRSGLVASFGSAFSRVAEESGLFSKKVFVGGLPPDIDEEEISRSFWRFGPLTVDWPTKGQTRHIFPPKGYVFLIFHYSKSVEKLVDECYCEGDDYFYVLSSASQKNKIVQVRAWRISDGECHFDKSKEVDSRLTAFVGGVPRPLRADQLAKIMNDHFGNVCHAVISVDETMDYPRGAGKVTFSSQDSYINAIQTRYVEVKLGELQKKVELKPYEDTVYERQRPRETHRQSHRRATFMPHM